MTPARVMVTCLLLTAAAVWLWLGSFTGMDALARSNHPASQEKAKNTSNGSSDRNRPSTAKLGKKVANVVLQNHAGKAWSLYDLQGSKAVVIVFLSFECPISNGYASLLADMAKDYQRHGVAWVGICADAENAKQARDFKIPFVVLKDDHGAAADTFKAEVTPEAFLLDHNFVLRYRGRIDDSYTVRLRPARQVTRHDLRQALDELLAGKPVGLPATQAVGCPVLRASAIKGGSGKVTFYRDVLPVLQKHCQNCHRPGAVAPFSLLTYRQAANWASDIKRFTQTRTMPPWKPVAGPGFHDERKLTDREIATLADWVDAGAPEGNPADAPPAREFSEGWQLGQPDLVLTVDEDFYLGPSGPDLFRCFVLPTQLSQDSYVTAVEIRPGNARAVHHAVLFYDTSGQARKLEATEKLHDNKDSKFDRGSGYSVKMGLIGFRPDKAEPLPIMGSWAPGQIARRLPDGTGYYLPRGADVIMQLHYSRTGRAEKDRTSIGLYLAKQPTTQRLHFFGLPALFLSIPAGAERHRVQGKFWVDQDCVLHSIFPHMHLIGREIKVVMTPPNGVAQTLIAINDWDFNWQGDYFFKQPIRVKAGTRFDIEGVFDNSTKNPANPYNPPQKIRVGLQTTDEMCLAGMGVTTDKPGRIQPIPRIPSVRR